MPLFRFHRGGLHESLQTTVVVKTFNDMVKEILMSFDEEMLKRQTWGAHFEVKPYPDDGYNFDPRIGWYTQIVSCNLYEENKLHPVGFLSEPFK